MPCSGVASGANAICNVTGCPIVDMKIADEPESFQNWSSVKFADKFLVFTNTESDKPPVA